MSLFAIRRVALRCFGGACRGACAVVLGAALSSSSVSGQSISLGDVYRSSEHDPFMALSCATVHHEFQPDGGIVDRYAAYQTRMRLAPRDTDALQMAFLLKPPFACTPRVDALSSQSLDELASLSDAEFAELGIRILPSRGERVGNFEQRREFDRRAYRAKEQFTTFRTLLRERRWEDAHDLLDELNPGGREANLLGLAQILLNSSDRDAQRYGRRCLDRIDGDDPVVALDAHLLAGAAALKERRWAEAASHYREVADSLPGMSSLIPEEGQTRRARETYFSRVYLAERQESYSRGLNDIDIVIGINPSDRKALLHKTVLLLLWHGPRNATRIEETRKFFLESFPTTAEPSDTTASPFVGPAELLLVDLEAQTLGHSPQLVERWEKTAAELLTRGLAPEVQAQVRLKSAELLAASLKLPEAREALAAAEQADRATVEAAPQWPALLFTLFDSRTARVFGRRFLAEPSDHESGRMLALALLDSADPQERHRGAAIADLLHRSRPDSVPLTVAAANAHFMLGRNDDALRLVEPIVGIRQATKFAPQAGPVQAAGIVYQVDARAFSPFDSEHLTQAWLIANAADVIAQERQELKQSPLKIESSIPEPAQPAPLSGDDAYLVARILMRMADGGTPERLTHARRLLDWVAQANQSMRYRTAAVQLQAVVRTQLSKDFIRPLDAPSLLIRESFSVREVFTPTALKPFESGK